MNYEKQVEELEKEIKGLKYSLKVGNLLEEQAGKGAFNDIEEIEKKQINKIKQKAKDLKAEIEKGCKEFIGKAPFGDNPMYCGMFAMDCETAYCPKCQNLINRLNKIIGEKE